MRTLGLLTIGQTPRTDYVQVIEAITGPSVRIAEKGVLDGMGREELARLAPMSEQEVPVVSRLGDGATVTLSKVALAARINVLLQDFAAERADLAVLMCTSLFHGVTQPRDLHVLEGQTVIDNAVRASVGAGARLGVLVPLASQEEKTRVKFEGLGYDVVTAHANPYGPMQDVRDAARALGSCAAVVLHCMGYVREHRAAVRRACGRPVLEANALVGHVAAELLAE